MSNPKKSFWTDPEGFSIIDLLALIYSLTYLGIIIYNIKFPSEGLTTSIGSLSPLIYIILSGYFTGQAVQQYQIYKNKPNDDKIDMTENNNV